MRHVQNYDEMKTQHRMCSCGHERQDHECYPDEHCYKCDCKEFKWVKNKKKMETAQ